MSTPLIPYSPSVNSLPPNPLGTPILPSTPTNATSSSALPPLGQTPPGTYYPGMGILFPNNSAGVYRRAPLTAPVKRACDGCHRRKVKCVGIDRNPRCVNCVSASLDCTYNSVPQKKGPKGVRAKVLCELRETQRNTYMALRRGIISSDGSLEIPNCSLRRHLAPTPGLLTAELIAFCSDYYFTNMQSVYPVFTRVQFGRIHGLVEQSTPAYCAVAAFCAFVIIQSQLAIPPGLPTLPEATISCFGYKLVKEVARVSKGLDETEKLTILDVYTPLFLHFCHSLCDLSNNAFTFLRQAATNAYLLGLGYENHYQTSDPQEQLCHRRLYWFVFISERAFSIKHHHPVILDATINLPYVEENHPDFQMTASLAYKANLYKTLDAQFFKTLTKVNQSCQADWLIHLQSCLDSVLPPLTTVGAVLTRVQIADLFLTKSWLQTQVWQLGMKHDLVRSTPLNPSLDLIYPFAIAQRLAEGAVNFSSSTLDILGLWGGEKLLDIGNSMIDAALPILGHNPPAAQEVFIAESIHRILDILSTIREGSGWHLQMLMSRLTETYSDDGHSITSRLKLVFPILDHANKVHMNSSMKVRTLSDLENFETPRLQLKYSRSRNDMSNLEGLLVLRDRVISPFSLPSPECNLMPAISMISPPSELQSRSGTPYPESAISSPIAHSHLNDESLPTVPMLNNLPAYGCIPISQPLTPLPVSTHATSLPFHSSVNMTPLRVQDGYSMNDQTPTSELRMTGHHGGFAFPISPSIDQHDSPQDMSHYLSPAWSLPQVDSYTHTMPGPTSRPMNTTSTGMGDGSIQHQQPGPYGIPSNFPPASTHFLSNPEYGMARIMHEDQMIQPHQIY